MIIFTDGSYLQETGEGAAIALKTEVEYAAYGPLNGISNYEMEAMAQSLALNHYIDALETDQASTNRTVSIFSDRQSALDLMNNPLTMNTAQIHISTISSRIDSIFITSKFSTIILGHQEVGTQRES